MTKHWEEQMKHEPTRVYYEIMKRIMRDCIRPQTPTRVLEIGSWWGISTRAILEFSEVEHLTSVDKNLTPLADGEVDDMGARARWTFVHADSVDYLPTIKEKFDIIFVDGDHGQAGASKDLNNAWELLVPGGYIILDDVFHKENDFGGSFGVARALWGLLIAKNRTAKTYPSFTGISVIQK